MITYVSGAPECPDQVRQCLDHFGHQFEHLDGRWWIAGGAVRDWFSTGVTRKDLDVFTADDTNMKVVRQNLEKHASFQGKLLYETATVAGYATNVGKVEVVKIHFPTPEDTINQFDFTVVCGVVDHEVGKPVSRLIVHDTFFIDLAGRRLVINALPFPLSTMERLQKMIKMGFTICNGGLLRIAQAIQAMDMANPAANQLEFYRGGQVRFRRID